MTLAADVGACTTPPVASNLRGTAQAVRFCPKATTEKRHRTARAVPLKMSAGCELRAIAFFNLGAKD